MAAGVVQGWAAGPAARVEPGARWVPLLSVGAVAGLVLVCNLLDGLFTLSFLELGLAEELNPLMRWAYGCSPVLFMGLKLATVQGGVWVLLQHRVHAAARWALGIGLLMYAAIVAYHLGFLLRVCGG